MVEQTEAVGVDARKLALEVLATLVNVKRIAIAPISEHELALVIRAPQLIGLARSGVPFARLRRPRLCLTRQWRSSTACTVEIAGPCASG